jgi:ribosomal protein L16 Arg81 hydroxylase
MDPLASPSGPGHVPGMFPSWLAPLDLSMFLETHLQKQPFASAGAAKGAVSLFGWDTLDRVLRSEAPLDVLTVRSGQLVDAPPPRSVDDARALMRFGVSVVVRGTERNDPGLAALAGSFRDVLPGEVHVQLYATPGGTNSYGWHYDFEDVFIAQTLGVKDYYFRENTVARETRLGEALDFTVFRQERSPLYSSRLEAGDFLYLPSRWWHLVKCAVDSLSISVGVMPREELRTARRLPPGWTGDTRDASTR